MEEGKKEIEDNRYPSRKINERWQKSTGCVSSCPCYLRDREMVFYWFNLPHSHIFSMLLKKSFQTEKIYVNICIFPVFFI